SFHVYSFMLASSLIGLDRSQTWPLTPAAITFLANPSDIDFAISIAVAPFSYCLTMPSGNVILIIKHFLWVANLAKSVQSFFIYHFINAILYFFLPNQKELPCP